MSNNGLDNIDDLFQSAEEDGLTGQTMDLVVANLNGPTMVGAVGMPLDEIESNEVTLAMNIIDRSSSVTSSVSNSPSVPPSRCRTWK